VNASVPGKATDPALAEQLTRLEDSAMRLRRPRLTIRLIMFVILVLGLLLGGGIYAHRLARRSAHYRQVAKAHAAEEQGLRRLIAAQEQVLVAQKEVAAGCSRSAEQFCDRDPWFGDERLRKKTLDFYVEQARWWEWQLGRTARHIENMNAVAAHYSMLKKKYERAAAYPWETLPPDPPEPTPLPYPPAPKSEPDPSPAPRRLDKRQWFLTLSDAHPTR
jgi:hypothetical protein